MKPHSHKFRQDLISSILNELYEQMKGTNNPESTLAKVIEKQLQETTCFSSRTIKDYGQTITPKLTQMLSQS